MTLIVPDNLRGRDYIETRDWSVEELQQAVDLAGDLKKKFRADELTTDLLPGKTIFLFFFDKSTRTRNSFEAGATQLGAHAHFVDADTSQAAHGEAPKDMGIILASYGHAIAIRHDLVPGEGNTLMREVAKWSDRPVLNMQCDVDHPCQTMADLMTIQEHCGKQNLKGRKIVVSWAYAPSYTKPMSCPQGLMMLMPRFGLDVTVAHPPGWELMSDTVEYAKKAAAEAGSKLEFTDDMDAAFENADIVYPKSWGIESLFGKPQEAMAEAAKYKSWICDERRMKLAKKDAIYMHCLPADRGNEVTDSVIDGPQSVVYQEAENRLHTCKALMALTM